MAQKNDSAEFFVFYLFSPIIIVLGLFGNIMGLIVLKGNKLDKLGPKLMYRILFLMDLIFLLTLIKYYMSESFDIHLETTSVWFCKFYYYITYGFSTISPMMLLYISIERIVSIKLPSKRFILRKQKYQIFYFLTVLISNLLLYSQVNC